MKVLYSKSVWQWILKYICLASIVHAKGIALIQFNMVPSIFAEISVQESFLGEDNKKIKYSNKFVV